MNPSHLRETSATDSGVSLSYSMAGDGGEKAAPRAAGRRPSVQRAILLNLLSTSPTRGGSDSSLASAGSSGTLRVPSLGTAQDSLELYSRGTQGAPPGRRPSLVGGSAPAAPELEPLKKGNDIWLPAFTPSATCPHGSADEDGFCWECFAAQQADLAREELAEEAAKAPPAAPGYDSGEEEDLHNAVFDDDPDAREPPPFDPFAPPPEAETNPSPPMPRTWRGDYRPPTLPRAYIEPHHHDDHRVAYDPSPDKPHAEGGKRVLFSASVLCSYTWAKEDYARFGMLGPEEEGDDDGRDWGDVDWGAWLEPLRGTSGTTAVRTVDAVDGNPGWG
ncbi:hypothetical protein DFJ74DRAFT_646819 [Hyaloraphidium curvatum]|nr:hypothetical protein DFJ74DRAFT_646819 [Hyaloraphidium curvatum]